MSNQVTLEFKIDGYFPDKAVIDWIIHRAQILDLAGWVNYIDVCSINIVVTGDPVLVDAMEVACSLGPANATVNTILRQETTLPVPFSRQARQFVRYSEVNEGRCSR